MAEIDQQPDEAPTVTVAASPQQSGLVARLRNYFLTGLVVAGPLAITVWLIWSILGIISDFFYCA